MTDETRPFEGKKSDGTLLPEGVYFYTLEVVNYPCNETSELRDTADILKHYKKKRTISKNYSKNKNRRKHNGSF